MKKYSVKLYDEELMSFSVGRLLDRITIKDICYDHNRSQLFPTDLRPTEDGILKWLRRRVIPKERTFANEILHSLKLHVNDVFGIIDVCKGLSLNDSFWITPSDFTGSYDDYNLYSNPFSEPLSVIAYTGCGAPDQAFTISPELTTHGMLPKAWRRLNGEIHLYKSSNSRQGNEPYAEFYAAQLAEAMGLNTVSYDLDRWEGILGSTCKLFTDKDMAYVPMGRLLHNATLADTIEFFKSEGEVFAEQLKSMLMFDILIDNEDRHFGNFGVLRDNHNGEIIAPAPLSDHGMGLFSQMSNLGIQLSGELFEDVDSFSPYYDNISVRDICEFAIGKTQLQQLRQLDGFRFRKHPAYNWTDERLYITEQCIKSRGTQLYNMAKEL